MLTPYFETKLGKLYHGDCLEIMPHLDPVDLVLTDPPYGVDKAEWDTGYVSVEPMLIQKAAGVIINCGEQNIATCVNALGDNYRGLFYGWNKNGMTRSSLGYMNIILAVCAGKIKLGQNFCQFTIKDLSRKHHPSPKPIEYIKCSVNRFSEEKDTILDPFMGTGTTLVAAKELGRKAIGIEISEAYCNIAIDRLRQGVFDF